MAPIYSSEIYRPQAENLIDLFKIEQPAYINHQFILNIETLVEDTQIDYQHCWEWKEYNMSSRERKGYFINQIQQNIELQFQEISGTQNAAVRFESFIADELSLSYPELVSTLIDLSKSHQNNIENLKREMRTGAIKDFQKSIQQIQSNLESQYRAILKIKNDTSTIN